MAVWLTRFLGCSRGNLKLGKGIGNVGAQALDSDHTLAYTLL
jgi:hypothetical protein